ncbi:PHB depolymerase family esterase [Pseudoruegeria sp. SK021]|uniref:extracellular catalytic domain type 1 short-chain-length polyhydroxyalkanoate depolymerase n=1 Tax=Pseudoruegeria sp. SK021 TaxID=1933035 RepID=UPI000A21C8DF|nr:PHB depolymerase family esterase [Pseudoruegeria sp. SK021]OSP56783.1 hypothetical protein BV911_02240 [Pseudoruegeria sp. SK021]
MTDDFKSAMRRALAQTRSGNLGDATRTLQSALNRGGAAQSQPGAATQLGTGAGKPSGDAKGPRIDPNAAEAEVLFPRKAAKRGSLRDVMTRLRDGVGGMPSQTASPTIPDKARYDWRSYSNSAGARDYRLYVPSSLSGTPRGLIVMLHGCTQSPDDFAVGTGMNELAEAHQLIVAYPSQTRAFNPMGCWNWFRSGDQTGTAGEPAILAGLATELAQEFGLDHTRVFAAGLSAGGGMADILGQTCPDTFAAIGVHSGLPAGAAKDATSAFAAMRGDAPAPVAKGGRGRPRIIVFHGSADSTVAPVNGDRLIALARDGDTAPATVLQGTSAGGRGYTRSTVAGADGIAQSEYWKIDGAGHAWSGGNSAGTYTDPQGPAASDEMVRFFLEPFTTPAR